MPAPIDRITLALVLLISCGSAYAATSVWPTQDAIERAREAAPFPSRERLHRAPLPSLPRITPAVPSLNLDDIVRRHIEINRLTSQDKTQSPQLRIFVSLSVPQPSLRLLVLQAEAAPATLVLRGLKANSMKQTLDTVQKLIGERKVSWQIDPEAFQRHGIHHAPTFVLADGRAADTGCTTSCTSAGITYRVAGDISLRHALETIVRQHPASQALVSPYLDRLKATP